MIGLLLIRNMLWASYFFSFKSPFLSFATISIGLVVIDQLVLAFLIKPVWSMSGVSWGWYFRYYNAISLRGLELTHKGCYVTPTRVQFPIEGTSSVNKRSRRYKGLANKEIMPKAGFFILFEIRWVLEWQIQGRNNYIREWVDENELLWSCDKEELRTIRPIADSGPAWCWLKHCITNLLTDLN